MPTVIEPIEDVHNRLCDLWTTWCEQNEISEISANDLYHAYYMDDDTSLTIKQIKFVKLFIKFWEIEND